MPTAASHHFTLTTGIRDDLIAGLTDSADLVVLVSQRSIVTGAISTEDLRRKASKLHMTTAK